MNTNHWSIPSAIQRQARAADLWLELTGRKQASMLAEKTASASDPAEPSPIGKYLKRGLIAGAALGAGVAGHAAHVEKTPIFRAALGGGVAGGAGGAALSGSFGLGRHVQRAVERPRTVPSTKGQPEDYLQGHDRLNPPEKKASAYDQLRQAVSASPGMRKAVGAAAVGAPLAAIGYAFEKGRHTPGPNGISPYQADARLDQERHNAEVDAGGRPLGGRLRKLYLALKNDAADEAAENPRLSGAIGAAAYGGLGALTGASLGSRILR